MIQILDNDPQPWAFVRATGIVLVWGNLRLTGSDIIGFDHQKKFRYHEVSEFGLPVRR